MTAFKPIIVIGAARSGTKMIRDMIGHHPEIDVVPYDVNYVWRLGNEHYAHDALPASAATPAIRERIRNHLGKTYSTGQPFLIEKTVSNCLRIPFIEAVYPNAVYIHLMRDGYDVVESSYRQWTSKPDFQYILAKLRTFPILQAPQYAVNYAKDTVMRLLSRGDDEGSIATWGPEYDGIDADLQQMSVLEVCARQWAICMETASQDLRQIPAERVHMVQYETFVETPAETMQDLLLWLGADASRYPLERLDGVTSRNIGKGRDNLSAADVAAIEPIIDPINEQIRKRDLL